jgi:outer membrane lipoprotein-sorting protein
MSRCRMKPRRLQKCRVPLLSLCLACAVAAWAAPSERAVEIMREVEKQGLADSQSYDGTIEVVAPNGKVLKRSWQLWREGNQDQSKLLLRFDSPPEMRGVAVLILNAPNAPPEQWLYTPSIDRERHLAAQDRSQRFMGTDLSHEDIEVRPVEDYDYDLLGEESFSGQLVYKIKAVCKDRNSTQYSQLILHVRKDILATTFTELYVGGKLRKTLLRDDWQQIQGIWTPLLLEMKDVAHGSTTRIRASNVKYNVKFDSEWFTVGNLRKIP